jgi:hypothetical protein
MLFQNCILLKDSRISPCMCSKKDFGSKTIRTGVSFHGAMSNRDSMWHSPVFTCISTNRIPVKRTKRTVVRNFEIEVYLHFTDLNVIWFNKIYCSTRCEYKNVPTPGNKLLWLKDFHDKPGKYLNALKIWKILKNLFPNICTISKTRINFPVYMILLGLF